MKYVLALAVLLLTNSVIAEKAVRVAVTSITPESAQRNLALTGTTRAARRSQLSSLTDGVVVAVHVDAGDKVTKGQLLLELDSALAVAQTESLKASLAQAQVMVSESQRRLYETKALSQKQFVAQTDLAERQGQLNEAKANLARAEADYRYQKELLARHRLYAPFSGLVVQRGVDIGEWLSRGDMTFELLSQETLWVDVLVPQEYFTRIDQQKSVPVRVDAHQDRAYQAEVIAKIPVVDTLNRSFLLRLAVPQTHELQVGLSARVDIPLMLSQDQIVMIPSDALLRQPDGRFSVFVIEDGRASRKSVQVGQRVNGYIEVLAGLEVGQTVVTEGNELLQDKQPVEIVQKTSENP